MQKNIWNFSHFARTQFMLEKQGLIVTPPPWSNMSALGMIVFNPIQDLLYFTYSRWGGGVPTYILVLSGSKRPKDEYSLPPIFLALRIGVWRLMSVVCCPVVPNAIRYTNVQCTLVKPVFTAHRHRNELISLLLCSTKLQAMILEYS